MIIYCDGIFDLFHSGHVKHFQKIKSLYENVYLIVGIIGDKAATGYKRQPIYNQEMRQILIESCKYVDQVLIDPPLIVTEKFIKEYKIDYVVHGFANKSDLEKQKDFFEVPLKLDKMLTVEYNHGISTTDIINKIKENY